MTTTYRRRWKARETGTPASNYSHYMPTVYELAAQQAQDGTQPVEYRVRTLGQTIDVDTITVETDAHHNPERFTASLDRLCHTIGAAVLMGRAVDIYSAAYDSRSLDRGNFYIKIDINNRFTYYMRRLSPAQEVQIVNALRNTVLHAGWQWAKAVQA